MRRGYRFAVPGYVVMREHFHLLVSAPQRKTLSTVMQAVEAGFQPPLALGTQLQPPVTYLFSMNGVVLLGSTRRS